MYRKEQFVFNGDFPMKAVIRNYGRADFQGLIQVQRESFPPPFPSELWWKEEQLLEHIERFPDGALCVEIDERIAGSMTAHIVQFDPAHPQHSWEEITDAGYIRNHDPTGDTLYVVDICVAPEYRKLGLGKWLMQSMYEVVVQYRLTRLLGGGRMPGYHLCAHEMTPQAYADKVVSGKLKDPVISFLLRCGRTPVQVIGNYLEDAESHHNALLLEWKNPFKR